MDTNKLAELKMMIKEEQVPYFTDDELKYYFNRNNQNLDATAYMCLTIKAEDTSLQIAGLTAEDSSKYYRRLANMYRPRNSGIIKGV